MVVYKFGKVWLKLALLLGLSGIGQFALNAEPLPAEKIIQKAVNRAEQAESSPGGYTYTKITMTEEFDSSGNVKERKEKVWEVTFRAGTTQVKLLEVNGHPPAEADLKKQAGNEGNLHQLLGQSKTTKGDNRENFLTSELAARFDFNLLGEANLNGRRTYQIGFGPKNPEPPVHRLVDRMLNRLSGTLWIDAEEFEIARAEVRLGSEVDLLGGVIGCLKKLAYRLDRTRVAEGVWFSTSSIGDFEGRKLLDSHRVKTTSQSSNFKPVTWKEGRGRSAES